MPDRRPQDPGAVGTETHRHCNNVFFVCVCVCVCVFQDAPLGSIFSQYLSRLPPVAQTKVRFHFDGSKVTDRQTPAQLDMEDGDIIERERGDRSSAGNV
uniref:NFATC2-interacting protein n=1 Tax=Dicentrarchus labrax TaxID=13489 RepID=A0A8P4K868_DICLA